MSAANLEAWGRDIAQFAREEPTSAIRLVDDAIRAQLRADTGDGAFSRGRKLGRATTRINRGNDSAEVVAAGSRSIWTILEQGTGGHEVRAKKGKVLRTPY